MTVQVGFAAYSGEPKPVHIEAVNDIMEGLFSECEPDTVTILLGGYRGLMRLIADAAMKHGVGRLVFIIPPEYEAMSYPEGSVVIRTGLGVRERSSILVRSSDVLVVVGGGIGTLFEVMLACSYGIPVLMLRGTGLESDRFANCYSDGILDSRLGRCIDYYNDPKLLGAEACRVARRKAK
ncbi:hypothetical protein [Hyperthermus butylicus]|uniref:Conserved archaeal protein n=1 Tax=Hyperthermus butylicus (strain DSM 5456 / JCM 9403 / PLM1-5) TaxID=415426 RepID=A2BK05_HYPBU|nr:hypothetical protein [Hyperthermus butylicus]ABM80316.1 conserved archaeal protein [Hyperthermus butylicus DSM 5456]